MAQQYVITNTLLSDCVKKVLEVKTYLKLHPEAKLDDVLKKYGVSRSSYYKHRDDVDYNFRKPHNYAIFSFLIPKWSDYGLRFLNYLRDKGLYVLGHNLSEENDFYDLFWVKVVHNRMQYASLILDGDEVNVEKVYNDFLSNNEVLDELLSYFDLKD